MLLSSEWRKAWSPLTTRLFLGFVCLAQIFYVSYNTDPNYREYAEQYNAHADSSPAEEFTRMLDSHVASLISEHSGSTGYGADRIDRAYSRLRAASENGELVFGVSPAAEGMREQAMVNWGFVLFLLYFAGSQAIAENISAAAPLLSVTRHGRRRLFLARFAVFQLSALFVWAAANLSLAVFLTFRCGWGIPGSAIQDFVFNSSPHVWNQWQAMTVVLCVSLAAGQVTAAVIFCLIYCLPCSSAQPLKSLVITSGAMVLPLILSMNYKNTCTALLLPCLMQNNWMWNDYRVIKIGFICLSPWQAAAAELTLAAILVWLRIRKGGKNVSI